MSKSNNNNFLSRRGLYAALALVLPVSAFAAITPAAGGAAVMQGSTPVVNIVAPNRAGVSHNRFEAFGVDASGAVLNNSVNAVKSQLAGQIDGNANLAGRAANVIIAEVTGKTATALNGALEIAGQKAALVIANPNGISADGGSFINASRVTLTTGTPQLDRYGRLGAIHVGQGTISISGKGLDASGAGRADLLARSVELNAKLQAKWLTVVTGANQLGYSSGYVAPGKASGDAPKVALDVAQLGGMYADAIQLVGTEKGVGVNIAGTVQAQNGGLSLDAAGAVNIAASGVLKAQNELGLSAGRYSADQNAAVKIAGQVESVNGSVKVASTGALDIAESGAVKAARYADLSGGFGPFGYAASDAAAVNVAGKVDAGSLSVNSAGALGVAQSGALKAQRDMYLSASNLDNAGTLTTVKGNLYARGPGLWASASSKFSTSGTISAGGRAYVTGFDDKVVRGTVHTAKGDFLLDEYGHQLKSGDEDHTGANYKAKWSSWMW